MKRVIGIDLGTTNCCVAVMDGFAPRVIANRHGYDTTPSIVAVTAQGKRLVGQIAARQAITNPEHTVHGAKRLMGRPFESPEVRHAIAHSAFALERGTCGDVRIRLGDRAYSVPEISAMLLQEMRVIAEEYIGAHVDQAVVTCPAYFNDHQRQAVRDAGRIAGLDVLRIVNEPTAAALAYGFGKGEDKTIAVYDLGGGTFDISIVRIGADGTFTVVATTGDSYLGGETFDERLMDWLIRGFEAQQGVDLRRSPIALSRLRQAAQKAKHDLSTLTKADVSLPFIVTDGPAGPLHMEYEITREQLEQLTGDLVTRTLRSCEEAVRMAQVRASDIDEVILVGGMTRMPSVQWAVREFFDREPSKSVHPDEVVAIGAAVQGAALTEVVTDITLHDVTAHSLGIMTTGGRFETIIPANTPVPARIPERFTTSRDGQQTVKIVVLQGESVHASDNEPLGRFAMSGLRSAPAGQVELEVTFTIDPDGLFSVSAADLETGEEQQIDVTASSGLDEQEIAQMMEDSARYLAERRAQESAELVRQTTESVVREIEQLVPKAERRVSWTPAGTAAISKARAAIAEMRTYLANDDVAEMAAHLEALQGVRGLLLRVVDGQAG